jgi:hypothetical protein
MSPKTVRHIHSIVDGHEVPGDLLFLLQAQIENFGIWCSRLHPNETKLYWLHSGIMDVSRLKSGMVRLVLGEPPRYSGPQLTSTVIVISSPCIGDLISNMRIVLEMRSWSSVTVLLIPTTLSGMERVGRGQLT